MQCRLTIDPFPIIHAVKGYGNSVIYFQIAWLYSLSVPPIIDGLMEYYYLGYLIDYDELRFTFIVDELELLLVMLNWGHSYYCVANHIISLGVAG